MNPALLSLAAAAIVAASAGPATARQIPPAAVAADRDDTRPDDIVVEGYRLRTPRAERVQLPTPVAAVQNRQAYEYAERLAKCAARGKFSPPSRLRAVVDGVFNSVTQATAQDRLKRIYITCTESTDLLSFAGRPASTLDAAAALAGDFMGIAPIAEIAPLGRSIYDRGAFTIQAMKTYAPGLTLTRRDTEDPMVQARFNLRELPRNRLRQWSDYRYFEVAVCMVRLQPALSVRLALSDGGARLGDLQEALIDRARDCVGGARKVKVDPTQFRLYIADAVYRWVVAARGVDTLIKLS